MRITLVTGSHDGDVAEALRDLGCRARTHSPLDPPAEIVRDVDAVVVDATDDVDVARFALGRCRGADARLPTLLVVPAAQLARVDPAWPFDDFILRPFAPHELYKRLRIVEWRASEFADAERVKVGDLVIDSAAHEVQLGGRRVAMAPREFTLLAYLAQRAGQVVSRTELLAHAWEARFDPGSNLVEVHVSRIRDKLGGDAGCIETVRGQGYRLRAEGAP